MNMPVTVVNGRTGRPYGIRHPVRTAWSVVQIVAASLIFFGSVRAQGSSSPISLSGTFDAGTEMYSSEGIDPRRPHNAFRAVFSPTISIFDQIRLPFEFYVTSEDRGFQQPFNQFGVNPELWGWLTLHAGYYTANTSELTYGDARMLGAGVEARPGNFRMAFLYGRIQQALAPDTANGFRGAFERRAWAAKIGYGAETGLHLYVNLMRAYDDSTSLSGAPPDVAPKENLVASVQYGIPLLTHALFLSGEFALATISNDTRIAPLDSSTGFLSSMFTPRYSSQVDGAATISLAITPSETWSLQFSGRWVGPGYVTLGYPLLQNDDLDGLVSPSVRLFDHKLSIRGSLGLRYNNLRNTKLSTTRRTIGTMNISVLPAPEWGVDFMYANYGMQSGTVNDTLRLANISQSVTISPRYTFPAFGGLSTTLLTYSMQQFTDFNTITGSLSDNTTHAGVVSWIMSWPSTFALTTTLMYTSSVAYAYETIVKGITETAAYSLSGAVSTHLSVGYTEIRTVGEDGQIVGRASVTYSPKGWGSFTLTISSNAYNYDPRSSAASFREHVGSLSYSYGF